MGGLVRTVAVVCLPPARVLGSCVSLDPSPIHPPIHYPPSTLQYLNRVVAPLLSYVDLVDSGKDAAPPSSASTAITTITAPADDTRSLSRVIRSLRGLYFTSTKLAVLDALLRSGGGTPDATAASMGLGGPGMPPAGLFGHPGGGFMARPARTFGTAGRAAFRGPHITINRMRASASPPAAPART